VLECLEKSKSACESKAMPHAEREAAREAEMSFGVLAVAVASAATLAILVLCAGSAHDRSKKLCEKLRIKKKGQGKARSVGDSVGDPFKSTSDPASNILLKIMSMLSLTCVQLLKDDKGEINVDCEDWCCGMSLRQRLRSSRVLRSSSRSRRS